MHVQKVIWMCSYRDILGTYTYILLYYGTADLFSCPRGYIPAYLGCILAYAGMYWSLQNQCRFILLIGATILVCSWYISLISVYTSTMLIICFCFRCILQRCNLHPADLPECDVFAARLNAAHLLQQQDTPGQAQTGLLGATPRFRRHVAARFLSFTGAAVAQVPFLSFPGEG